MALRLSLDTLDRLPESIGRPGYARADLSGGIVHVGVGNFHRAHQAVYLDDLFNKGLDHDWALVGAGVRPGDIKMRDALASQDWLTTVVELEPGANSARVTGAMTDFVPVVEGNGPLVNRLADPATRIASLTVTEGGYYIDPATGVFDPEHPDIKADAAKPEAPATVFGAIIAALRVRREAGTPPFTVMSCDNLPGNGHVARDAVVGLAELIDSKLAAWIRSEVAFPDAMVDRITPATSERERAYLTKHFGIEDAWPVFCEPFRQWVLADEFTMGRPRLEEVGVTLTTDVTPYETMKIRILNGGHATIAYPAALMGLDYAFEAMRDPLIKGFLDKVETEEIIPILPPVPDTDHTEYYAKIVERFGNEDIADTIPRLCFDGSNRQPKFILPSTRDRLKQGLPVDGLALESALWCRYCAGTRDDGTEIKIEDENAQRLITLARAAKAEPAKFLEMKDIFGDLAGSDTFRTAFSASLKSLWDQGTAETLSRYIKG